MELADLAATTSVRLPRIEASASTAATTPRSSSASEPVRKAPCIIVTPKGSASSLVVPASWVLSKRSSDATVFRTPAGERIVRHEPLQETDSVAAVKRHQELIASLGPVSKMDSALSVRGHQPVVAQTSTGGTLTSAASAGSASTSSSPSSDISQVILESTELGVRFALKEGAIAQQARLTNAPSLHYVDDSLLVNVQRAAGVLSDIAGGTAALDLIASKGLDPQHADHHGVISSLAALFGVPRTDLFSVNVAGVNGLSYDEKQDGVYCRTFLLPVGPGARDLLVVRWEAPVAEWNPKVIATFRHFMDSWTMV